MSDVVGDAPYPDDESQDSTGPLDVPALFRSIVRRLQVDPVCYKRFGVYWWPVKALLRRAGYGRDQLYLLGSYQDPETAASVPRMGLDETLRAALDEFRFNTMFPHADGRVEDPDGDLVAIVDNDAAL